MKKKNLLKRGLAFLLTTVMAVGLVSYVPIGMTNVQAADGDTTTKTLGASVIADPTAPTSTSDAWTGSYVYFGTYNGSPVKYRVLDSNTTVYGGTTMLLDCDSVLWAGSNPSSKFDDSSNVWSTSYIKRYLNSEKDESGSYDYSSTGFLTTAFSATEQNAIASSTKSAADSTDGSGWSALNYAPLSNDKIFFLDAKEATNTSYGYSNTDYDAENRKKQAVTPIGGCGRLIRAMFTTPATSIRSATSTTTMSASILLG